MGSKWSSFCHGASSVNVPSRSTATDAGSTRARFAASPPPVTWLIECTSTAAASGFDDQGVTDIPSDAQILVIVFANRAVSVGNRLDEIVQAIDLYGRVNHPNVMIKIPATLAGLPAITEVVAAGINVNVTLIFDLDRYDAVLAAFDAPGGDGRLPDGLRAALAVEAFRNTAAYDAAGRAFGVAPGRLRRLVIRA